MNFGDKRLLLIAFSESKRKLNVDGTPLSGAQIEITDTEIKAQWPEHRIRLSRSGELELHTQRTILGTSFWDTTSGKCTPLKTEF